MQELVRNRLEGRKIIIAGFGREGRSTYHFLRRIMPLHPLTIADFNMNVAADPEIINDDKAEILTGDNYLENLQSFDIIFKTPGIPTAQLPDNLDRKKITSQTDVFLRLFGRQVIGITGTKGKSTTSSLVHHILKSGGRRTVFVGNIGIPPLDMAEQITPDTIVVMELSSHQLEYLTRSPHISVLLNIFQEHLDHYNGYEDYQQAKFNIGRYQETGDFFLYNSDNDLIVKHLAACKGCKHLAIPFTNSKNRNTGIFYRDSKVILDLNGEEQTVFDDRAGHLLKGQHNLLNIMAAAASCFLAGIDEPSISKAVRTFSGLEHRIEYVGKFGGIEFYNDSIATIPEASIAAVKTLQQVDTLILGGFDRGIDYGVLYPFLAASNVNNLIFIGEAGARMKNEFEETHLPGKSLYLARDFNEVVEIAFRVTARDSICLLSPAAASYDMFKNFEERGRIFKKLISEYKK